MVIWKKTWGYLLCGFGCLLLLLALDGFSCRAGETKTPGQITVADDASLLSEEEAKRLKSAAEELAGESGWNVIAATCDDAAGKSARTLCEDYFNTYTAGDDGVSCLIDMDNREIYLSTAGEAICYLTDSRIDDILDDAYEAVSEGDYSECLYRMLTGVKAAYQRGMPDNLKIYDADTGEVTVRRRLTIWEFAAALCAALAAGIVVFASIVGKYRLKWGTYEYDFHESGEICLTKEEDRFVNQVVTHRHIPKNTGTAGSGGGSRSTVHRGSGGRSFGGGGRRF